MKVKRINFLKCVKCLRELKVVCLGKSGWASSCCGIRLSVDGNGSQSGFVGASAAAHGCLLAVPARLTSLLACLLLTGRLDGWVCQGASGTGELPRRCGYMCMPIASCRRQFTATYNTTIEPPSPPFLLPLQLAATLYSPYDAGDSYLHHQPFHSSHSRQHNTVTGQYPQKRTWDFLKWSHRRPWEKMLICLYRW